MMKLANNNYLGVANDPRVCERAIAGLKEFGLGAGSERFLAGNFREHEELEHVLAQLHGTEAALVFSSGYAANLATLSAIIGPRDTAFCDALSHASLVEGCRVPACDASGELLPKYNEGNGVCPNCPTKASFAGSRQPEQMKGSVTRTRCE